MYPKLRASPGFGVNLLCTRRVWRYQSSTEVGSTVITFYYTKNDYRVATLRLTLIDPSTNATIGSTTVSVSGQALRSKVMYTVSITNNFASTTIYYYSSESYTVNPGSSYTYTVPGGYSALLGWPSADLKLRLPSDNPDCAIELPYAQYVADEGVTVVFYNAGTASTYFNVYLMDLVPLRTMTLKIDELDSTGAVLYTHTFTVEDIPPLSLQSASTPTPI